MAAGEFVPTRPKKRHRRRVNEPPVGSLSANLAAGKVNELLSQSPQNGNIRGQGQRLSAISTLASAHWEYGDDIECAKSRDFRLILALIGKPGQPQDWMGGAG